MKRRTSEDSKWQEVKARVKKRDKGCRLLKVLTPQEFLVLKKNAGSRMDVLDPAHVLGCGPFPHLTYLDCNVVLLNRYSHDNLDYFKDPVTGKAISKEEHTKWWIRILGEKMYKSLITMSTHEGELYVRPE